MKKTESKIYRYFKLLAIFIIASLLLMQTGTLLRKLLIGEIGIFKPKVNSTMSYIAQEKPHIMGVYASTETYYLITENTLLYRTKNDTLTEVENYYFMLPKSYYVKVLNAVTLTSGKNGYYVSYNNFFGYCHADSLNTSTTYSSGVMQSDILLSLNKDGGTYLRSVPKIDDANKIKLLDYHTEGINYIGSIVGEKPTDGTSDIWYFCVYNSGETTSYSGYIYSERCSLSKPLEELTTNPIISSGSSNDGTTEANANLDTNLATSNLTISNGLKWFLVILFTIPILIIFVMLIKKPRSIVNESNSEMQTNPEPYKSLPLENEDQMPELNDIDIKSLSKIKKPKKFKRTSINELSPFLAFKTTQETSTEIAQDQVNNSGNKVNNNGFAYPNQTNNYNSNNNNNNEKPKTTSLLSKFFNVSTTNKPNEFKLNPPTNSTLLISDKNNTSGKKFENAIYENVKEIKMTKQNKQILDQRTKSNLKRNHNYSNYASDNFFEVADMFEPTRPVNAHFLSNTKNIKEDNKYGSMHRK